MCSGSGNEKQVETAKQERVCKGRAGTRFTAISILRRTRYGGDQTLLGDIYVRVIRKKNG
jgi:hypothetical protein